MSLHLLSGDSLVVPFGESGVEGEVFVCRECLVDGPRNTSSLEEFWEARKNFLVGEDEREQGRYDVEVVSQYIDLWNASDGKEVVFWFERELFCQINMYFSIWMLRNTDARFSIAYPVKEADYDPWLNWSGLSPEELAVAHQQRIRLNHDDVFQAVGLWEAYASGDIAEMESVAKSRKSDAFPTAEKIVELVAGFEQETEKIVKELINQKGPDFGKVFGAFVSEHPEYGLGDLQVKRIFDRLIG